MRYRYRNDEWVVRHRSGVQCGSLPPKHNAASLIEIRNRRAERGYLPRENSCESV